MVSGMRPVWYWETAQCCVGNETSVVLGMKPVWYRETAQCCVGNETSVVLEMQPACMVSTMHYAMQYLWASFIILHYVIYALRVVGR